MTDLKNKAFDAIIAGAGPAGSSCALFLARAGRKVLLVDKAKFPREKVCGDAISGKSVNVLRELGLLELISRQEKGTVNGVKLVAPSGNEVTVPFPKAIGLNCAGYCLRRKQTDDILFQAAKLDKNISVMENFIVSSLLKNEKNEVTGIEGGAAGAEKSADDNAGASGATESKKSFYSKIVIGADGSGSIVARNAGLPHVPPEHTYMAIRGYWSGVSGLTDNIELFFIDEVLPGYLWIFPMGDGTANVGLGILLSDVKNRKTHPNKILLDAVANSKSLKKRFANSKLEGNIGAWTIPLGSHKRKLNGDGWALVGDAASLVDPFSGEGFGNAVSSGKFAAVAIDNALKNRNEKDVRAMQTAENKEAGTAGNSPISEAELSEYSSLVQTELYPEMETTYKLQRASRHKFLIDMFISKAAKKPEFRQMIISMLASNEGKKKVESPLFYLKLLLF